MKKYKVRELKLALDGNCWCMMPNIPKNHGYQYDEIKIHGSGTGFSYSKALCYASVFKNY